tara:strand:- start:948 stop:1670 length:723 start_codon:yes stop_codon:yes gene_type:complete
MKLTSIAFLVILTFQTSIFSQIGVTTVGVQLKPIIPINYFGAGPIQLSNEFATLDLSSKLGYSFGMVVRHGFTKSISIESGINYTRRNYNIFGASSYEYANDQADFGFISYELPVQGLIYIRIGEFVYMNASIGLGINFYASDVASKGENNYIDHYSERARWINASFLSNLGLELRTKEKGYFYVGASLNTPFNEITATRLNYYYEDNLSTKFDPIFLNGNYITLDLRYFFNPRIENKKN